ATQASSHRKIPDAFFRARNLELLPVPSRTGNPCVPIEASPTDTWTATQPANEASLRSAVCVHVLSRIDLVLGLDAANLNQYEQARFRSLQAKDAVQRPHQASPTKCRT